jgi:N-acetylglutamate synthase-like GNAT family acetyltransferase
MPDKEISIIEFKPTYAVDFKRLNLEWLEKYRLTEPQDLKVINNPQKEIIDTGGFIFLARYGNKIVGTAAMIKESATRYELVKMAVAPALQGKGIGNLLIEACLKRAKKEGAKKIYLQSNSQLTTAISLYKKFGFKHIPVKNTHYLTADVMMELLL